MTVKCIRFISGENVVCDFIEETTESIKISEAIVAIPANQDGTQLAFAPFAPLQDPDVPDLEIDKKFVMYITKVTPNLEQQYNKMFNRVHVPEKKLIL